MSVFYTSLHHIRLPADVNFTLYPLNGSLVCEFPFEFACTEQSSFFRQVTISWTCRTWWSVSSVGFAAVPVIVKTMRPLFLVLLFFMSRIEFPVSLRTMECRINVQICLDINIEEIDSMWTIYGPDPSVVMLHQLLQDNSLSGCFCLNGCEVEESSRGIKLNNKVLELV